MADDSLQLRDPVPVERYLPEPVWPWWAWALVALGLALAVFCAVRLFRKKHAGPPPLPVDRGAAYRRAVASLDESAGLPAHEAATVISSALRRYLAETCGDSSLYETHQEFLARHRALEGFPAALRQQVSELLGELADLKYDQPRSQPAADLRERSRQLLDELHQTPLPEPETAAAASASGPSAPPPLPPRRDGGSDSKAARLASSARAGTGGSSLPSGNDSMIPNDPTPRPGDRRTPRDSA